MESIIADAIRHQVRDKISLAQHGFSKGKSTVTQLLETLEDWTTAIDNNQVIDVLYIDIAKAFDSVSHPKLISKLRLYGVRIRGEPNSEYSECCWCAVVNKCARVNKAT
jgi:hypothetical protein